MQELRILLGVIYLLGVIVLTIVVIRKSRLENEKRRISSRNERN